MGGGTQRRPYVFLLLLLAIVVIFLPIATTQAQVEDDVRCLEGLKSSLQDPLSKLGSWNFSNTSSSNFICDFPGVSCWNQQESRIIVLQLTSFNLSGQIPSSLQFCSSITTLDLSYNSFSGQIPSSLCNWLPFPVSLDLSHNKFSGQIPPELSNCKFLNTLRINDNLLSGQIPYQLSNLDRLKTFSVANNRLSGVIPQSFSSFDPAGFEGNDGLCGDPLGSGCGRRLGRRSLIIIIAAGVFGAVASLLLGLGLWWWCFARSDRLRRRHRRRKMAAGYDDSEWAERLRPHKFVQVSLFQKPIVKIKLADLLAATNNFHPENIINSSRTGTSYQAVLRDGSVLAIKRLRTCKLSEKQFRSEMNSLGQLRHPNLVPLLGFCIVQDEKLLVYKHMPNGTLASLLQSNLGDTNSSQFAPMDWASRLKIGIGAARGLAWLHHGFQPPFLHQNISSNAILLDEDYEARITDFGLATLVGTFDSNSSPFVNGDFGDLGYVAPEYPSTLVASLKGDVYAFGVVLLELVTGQKPLEVTYEGEGFKENLVEWVNRLSGAGRIKDVIDKSLCGKGHDDEILQFLTVACDCVVASPKDRSSMDQVYQSLRTIGEGYDFSEQFDDFPLIFGKEDHDKTQ
ncbi:putative inactive receptor kinase At1g27190 [Tasmannia lanceolata]|uniref:putative inactive receptor kinase At1g27190 n=1 Tax=Tasmannia lanceolata TaxID=3420 RepID=UPI004064C4CF